MERLLLLGAPLNTVYISEWRGVNGNYSYSTTAWEHFIFSHAWDEKSEITLMNTDTFKMMELLLDHAADPFVWVLGGEDWFIYFLHDPKGLIYWDCSWGGADGRRPSDPDINLRCLAEVYGPPNKQALLAKLPTHEEYEEEWRRCEVLSIHQARRRQDVPKEFLSDPDLFSWSRCGCSWMSARD